jgi:hypothetical protein
VRGIVDHRRRDFEKGLPYFEHGTATFASLTGKPGWTYEW